MRSQDTSDDGPTATRARKDTFNPQWNHELCQMEVSHDAYALADTDCCRENQSHFQSTLQHKVHAQTERYVCSYSPLVSCTDEQDGETSKRGCCY